MPVDHDATITRLMERWVAGDSAAGAEIYRRYHERAWAFAMRLTGRKIDADDISQEALAAGLEGIKGGVRPDRFTGWILGITRNAARLARDKQKRAVVADMTYEQFPAKGGPRTEMIRAELDTFLHEIVAGLDAPEREALYARVVGRLRREDAAAQLGVSPAVVDRRLSRALAQLRGAMSKHATTQVLPTALESTVGVTLAMLAQVRPASRQAFELHHVLGRSVAQAASQLAVPRETIRARLDHAYKQLACTATDDFSALRTEYRARLT